MKTQIISEERFDSDIEALNWRADVSWNLDCSGCAVKREGLCTGGTSGFYRSSMFAPRNSLNTFCIKAETGLTEAELREKGVRCLSGNSYQVEVRGG